MRISPLWVLPVLMVNSMAYALPIVKVNFVFATTTEKAQKLNHKDAMQKQIEKLNTYFKSSDQKQIFEFKLNSFTNLDQTKKQNCAFFKLINRPASIDPKQVMQSFNQCFEPEKGTVHYIVFDGYSEKNKFNSITSWGFNNQNHPFVLIDWYQLRPSNQTTNAHEMGHAFGLTHVCEPNIRPSADSNIMTSSRCSGGSSGQQNQGFDQKQLETITKYYQKLIAK